MQWIRETDYALDMKEKAEPYVAQRRTPGTVERIKGQPVYYEYFRADREKGVIVLSHGFTESVKKFTESIYYMLQAGYSVWGVDHRGHGRSFRSNDNPYVVHVEHFEDYVQDLRYLTETLVVIEQYPALFTKAVLSSPMLGLSFSLPTPVMFTAASLMGLGKRKRQPLSPVKSFPDKPDFEHSCDSSECRYIYYFNKQLQDKALQTRSPSIGWGLEAVKACARVTSEKQTGHIRIPVLLFQAGDDTVVKNFSQVLFASRVPTCEMSVVPCRKHELYMTDSDVLIPYWERIFSFLGWR